MELVLDCESQDSAVDSLCNLFNCSRNDFNSVLIKTDIETVYKDVFDSPDYHADELIYREMVTTFGMHEKLEYIHWFHLTRTMPDNKFQQGILPLGKSLDLLWDTLFQIFDGTEHYSRLWEMKKGGVENDLYQLKTPDPFQWGPFAMLVRDSAFKAEKLNNHDYLRLPEIIEDICNDYYKRFGVSIHDTVVESLKPCIVKFKSSYRLSIGCIGLAILYVYTCVKGEPLFYNANTTFDAEGNTIPPKDILNIEFL